MGENDAQDFGNILAAFEAGQGEEAGGKDPRPGEKAKGRVVSIGEETAFVGLGAKSDAVVSLTELRDDDGELTVAVGDEIEGVIAGRDEASGCLVLRVRPGAAAGLGAAGSAVALDELTQAREHGLPVEGMVTEVVKGGVEVTVSGLRAFCPISQLERGFVEDAAPFVGRRLTFRVRKVGQGRGRRPDIVLSRRDLLEAEERERREEALARLVPGAVVRGTVTSVTGYGAFVDLGGVEGLLHVSEMSHGRVESPADVVSSGDSVEVKVLKVEEGREGKDRRISLSRRALEADPWKDVAERFPAGGTVAGRVTRLEPYGAFVALAPGLEGLVHVSELGGGRRVGHPREVVELGQDVEVRVLGVDAKRRRVSLALETGALPEEAVGGEEARQAERRSSGSGFGSLGDFFDKAKKQS